MSVWGKTMTSLGSLFSPLGTSASLKHMFERCVNARTKKEEEWLIKDCLEVVENRLKDPSTTPSMMIRGLAFVVFANVLGYKSEFASIHAIRLAQLGSLHEKKIGYLSCIFLIKHTDPVSIMIMNTILRDLGSKNILVVAMAVSATCYLIPQNLASIVLPLLAEKLHHPSEFLRSKAVVVFHHFLRTCPDLCGLYLETVCALLGDRDPCVVGHVLQFLLDVVKINKTLMKFIPFFIKIQDQILTNKLPAVENYRNLPAPWMQMTLLRLLQCSEEHKKEIVTVCHKTLSVLNLEKFPLQEALKIECFNLLIKCEGGEKNLNLTMKYCKELLFSSSSNMRYAALDLLQNIIQHYHIALTPDIQEAISRCLKYNDSTVTYKILRLLCVAANEKNVDMVCSQVVDNVHSCYKDNMHFQIELIKEAIILTEKFPNTNNYWHVAMLIRLLSLAGEKQSKLIQHKIKNALSSESTQNVFQARRKVLQILRKYSDSKTASTSVLEIFVWSLSHFEKTCLANSDSDAEGIVREIVHLGRKIVKNQIVKSYFSAEVEKLLIAINDALTQISYQNGVHSDIVEYIEEVKSMAVNNSYLHIYCQEIVHGLPHVQELHKCFKGVDWHKEIKGIDFTLSFLDWYVCESLIGGETLYNVKHPEMINPHLSELDSECFLYQDVNYNRDSSGFCTSPVCSERESCFGSGIYEELKFFSAKRSEKEVAEPRIVWSKTGHKQNYNVKTDEGDIQQIYFIKNVNTSEKPDSLFSQEGDKCTEEQDGEGLDPLDKLLKQDFPKLLLKTEKTDGSF